MLAHEAQIPIVVPTCFYPSPTKSFFFNRYVLNKWIFIYIWGRKDRYVCGLVGCVWIDVWVCVCVDVVDVLQKVDTRRSCWRWTSLSSNWLSSIKKLFHFRISACSPGETRDVEVRSTMGSTSGVGDFCGDDRSDTLDSWSETDDARSDSSWEPLMMVVLLSSATIIFSPSSVCSRRAGGGTGAFLFLMAEANEAFEVLDTCNREEIWERNREKTKN